MIEGTRIEEGQVAREHQPRGVRVSALRGEDAAGRTEVLRWVQDLLVAGPQWIVTLLGAHRYEGMLHARLQQLHGALQLGQPLVFERGLVAQHPPAASAGEHQSVERRDRAHGRAAARPLVRR